tara:strand:+ start:50 stop:742 length:693 start_codon:yes stop_codon:yes gene_type:complete
MKIALLISTDGYDQTLTRTVSNISQRYIKHVGIIQGASDPNKYLDTYFNNKKISFDYHILPNLSDSYLYEEAITRRKIRDFTILFKKASELEDITHCVVLTDDTLMFSDKGVRDLISTMKSYDCDIACCKKEGKECISSDKTDIQVKHGIRGGRVQDLTNSDFPSDFFIIRKDMATAFVEMPCVNKWCIDQVLGEALLAANGLPYIFSHSSTDEMYIDGIVTNYTKRFFN